MDTFKINSVRPFIGARDFEISRRFYTDLGFVEKILSDSMSVFTSSDMAFYLQKAYIKDWIDNTMIFIEVENLEDTWNSIAGLDLPGKYATVKLNPISNFDWGREFYLHDPSGILWHFGEFAR